MVSSPPTLTARQIGRGENARMLEILRASPIVSPKLSICFDRQPDIFAMTELKYDPAVYVGFFVKDELIGFVLLGFHDAYVNGAPTRVMHLTDYYVLPAHRGRGTFRQALSLLSEHFVRGIDLGYAIIMHGNRAAETILERDPSRLPLTVARKSIGTLEAHSILVAFRRRRHANGNVRMARPKDIDAIVELLCAEHAPRLFAPLMTREIFASHLRTRPGFGLDRYYVAEKSGSIVGVCAAWDTDAFKQNRVVRYSLGLQLTRLGYSALRPILGFPRLPKPGEAFRDVHITDCAIRDRDPEIMADLLETVYDDCLLRGYNSIIFGSEQKDPLLLAARRFTTEVVRSHIVLFSLTPSLLTSGGVNTSLPYVDLALL